MMQYIEFAIYRDTKRSSLDMSPTSFKVAYKKCSPKSINFGKLEIDGFPLEMLSPNIPHSTDFASKSQISDSTFR